MERILIIFPLFLSLVFSQRHINQPIGETRDGWTCRTSTCLPYESLISQNFMKPTLSKMCPGSLPCASAAATNTGSKTIFITQNLKNFHYINNLNTYVDLKMTIFKFSSQK